MPLLPETPRRRHSLPHISDHWQQQPCLGIVSNGHSHKRRRHSSFVESPMANLPSSFGNPRMEAFSALSTQEYRNQIPMMIDSSLFFHQNGLAKLNGNIPMSFPDPTISVLQQRLLYQQQYGGIESSFSSDAIQQLLLQQQFYRSIGSSASSLSSFQPLVMNSAVDGTTISRKRTFESSTLPHLVTPSTQWHEYQGHGTYNGSIHNILPAISPDLFKKNDPAMCENNLGTGRENCSNSQLTIHRTIRRRLHSMTRGTKLIHQNLPPVVIESGIVSSTDVMDGMAPQNSEWATNSFISIQIPANVSYIWKSNKTQEVSKVKSNQSQHQVFLRTHALLGEGAFATVVTCTLVDSPSGIGCRATDNKDNRSYYACKYIKDTIFDKAMGKQNESDASGEKCDLLASKQRRAFIQAQSQLDYEAHLLGSLHHPNIIQLIGFFPITGKGTLNDALPISNNGLSLRSALLIELLDETLAQKLSGWKNASNNDFRYLENEKISICQQLAEALEYVHSHNIAYRDLKPENVGFVGKTLKLFDFGLSREMISRSSPSQNRDDCSEEKAKLQSETLGVTQSLTSCSSHSNSVQSNSSCSAASPTPPSEQHRLLRGRIGTMRYMAPEVCLEEDYDLDCDIYSYSVLCWEIWTHKTPYYMLTPASYVELVCLQDFRPPQIEHEITKLQQQQQQQQQNQKKTTDTDTLPIPSISACALPKAMKELLEKGWVRDPKYRIRWREIRQELSRMETGHPETS